MKYALQIRSALRALAALAVALAAFVAAPAPVQAQQAPPEPQAIRLEPGDGPPPRFRVEPREAVRIADRLAEVQKAVAEHGPVRKEVLVPLYYVRHPLRYEISYNHGETTVAEA